jgi:hypothetical protein
MCWDGAAGLSCPAVSAGFVSWPLTLSGVTEENTCPPGYSGSPSRLCQLDGNWATIANPCIRTPSATRMVGRMSMLLT